MPSQCLVQPQSSVQVQTVKQVNERHTDKSPGIYTNILYAHSHRLENQIETLQWRKREGGRKRERERERESKEQSKDKKRKKSLNLSNDIVDQLVSPLKSDSHGKCREKAVLYLLN